MGTQVFDDEFAPVFSEIGFLECDAAVAASAYMDWQSPIQAKRNVVLKSSNISGGLRDKILSLLPLTTIERRRALFLPTNSQWTAYLDNGALGTDAFSAVSYLAKLLNCRGVRSVSKSDVSEEKSKSGRHQYGGTVLELYAPLPVPGSQLNTLRSIYAMNDGGRWEFGANGDVQEFEDMSHYKKRRIQDRFNADILAQYLSSLGIDVFSHQYYETPSPAHLVTKDGPSANGMASLTLAEAANL